MVQYTNMPVAFIALLILSIGIPMLVLPARTWTDINGRTFEGDYIDASEDSVLVERHGDGMRFEISLARLSEADRAFVAGQQVDLPEAETARPSNTFPEGGLQWPDRVRAPDFEVEIIREDNDADVYIYRTDHFEFISDVKLARKVVRDFAEIFEATLAAIQSMPLQWNIRIPEKRFQTELFKSKSDYHEAGGIIGSGGIYMSSRRKIMIPLDALGTKKSSSGVTLDDDDHSTLIHEITHQVQHDWLQRMPIWLVEGMAVYTEAVPYKRGQFRFDRHEVEDFIREQYRYYEEVPVIDVQKLMTITSQGWNENFRLNIMDVSRFYMSAYLLAYYFIHLEGEGEGRAMWDYLRAIQRARTQEDRADANGILLRGRTYEQLYEDMQRAYKREGIDLVNFQ